MHQPTILPVSSSTTSAVCEGSVRIWRHIGSRCSTVTPARRSAPNTCSYADCQVRTCTSAIAAASSGRARRTSTGAYLPAEEETNFATAAICASVSLPLNAGITPPPTST